MRAKALIPSSLSTPQFTFSSIVCQAVRCSSSSSTKSTASPSECQWQQCSYDNAHAAIITAPVHEEVPCGVLYTTITTDIIPWRSPTVLDKYVDTPARPISLRQLIFFGSRHLDSKRIINSANYVRTELPTRISHRIRDMQKLPYVVVTNRHISYVYNLYYEAFESLRAVPEIKTEEDNDRFCEIINTALRDHLTVIPRLAMGVLECRDLLPPEQLNRFMNTLLRSRISRRVIAEQHLALTETHNAPFHSPSAHDPSDFVGEVFLRCNAREVVERVGKFTQDLIPPGLAVPQIKLEGHLDTSFPYILSHLEYIIGELLRNSIEATLARHPNNANPPPITVLICNAPKHIIFRVSDQGGGIPPPEVSDLWSFAKHTRSDTRLRNFAQVPKMSATLQELHLAPSPEGAETAPEGSLHSLTYRRPDLKLGMGLPMSRVYAEYWGGSLEQTSMEGYGTDVFLHIEKLGNRLEQLNIDSL
ncbi:branched-chain alpha-ketoacid dehydrogenase [Geopyxis carbonaria]|nr:branched-chain alpha-ketoacid dehydrogenase [Geopyxis carbonaria]